MPIGPALITKKRPALNEESTLRYLDKKAKAVDIGAYQD
jgi:hypothetical protein